MSADIMLWLIRKYLIRYIKKKPLRCYICLKGIGIF